MVFIDGFVARTVIGIDPPELNEPQPVRFDLTIGQQRSTCCISDDIRDTIHYGLVLDSLRRLLREHRFKMLERLAEEVAQMIIQEFRAEWVRVRITKPSKFPSVEGVGVQIERDSARAASPSPQVNKASPTASVSTVLGG